MAGCGAPQSIFVYNLMVTTVNSGPQGAKPASEGLLRRIGEDKLLRPFLTVHFNATEYISDIIRQGKSEAVFADVSKYVEDVKEEIQVKA